MATIATVLKDVIRRTSRREFNQGSAKLRRGSAQFRRDIASLKRTVAELVRRLSFVESQEKRRITTQPVPPLPSDKQLRYSSDWLRKHRQKLGLSAADYGKLVGVTQLTIYNWEHDKAKPRRKQMAALAGVRALRKREVLKRLELLGQQ
jgi:DNA-binding XRE family transcriptional regulator